MFYPAVISSDGSDRTGKLVMSGAMRAAAVLGALLTGAAAGAGEHPRLLVDAAGLAKLRADAQREPGASILAAMDKALAGYKHDGGLMYDMAPRHQAALYLAGGDRKHAAAAEAKVLAMVRDREFWNNPGSKGLTRCAGALTVALAYDACHDVWPDAVRREVSAKLLSAAQGIMKSMGAGANTKLANNWQAVRYAGAGIAALACDEPGADKIAADAYGKLKAHLNANLGENGWNPEGIGYTVYPWIFTGPFGVAAHRARLGDLRTEVKRAALTHWTCFAGTTPIPHTDGLGLRADLSDDHPAYRGHGTAGLAFWYAPREQLPALRWMYDRLFGAGGDKSYDTMDAGGIYSLLFYPADVPAKNPAEVVGRTYTDRSHGVCLAPVSGGRPEVPGAVGRQVSDGVHVTRRVVGRRLAKPPRAVVRGLAVQRPARMELRGEQPDAALHAAPHVRDPGPGDRLVLELLVGPRRGLHHDAGAGKLPAVLLAGPVAVVGQEHALELGFHELEEPMHVGSVAGQLCDGGEPPVGSEHQMLPHPVEVTLVGGAIAPLREPADPFLAVPVGMQGAAGLDGVRVDDEKGGRACPAMSQKAGSSLSSTGTSRTRRSAKFWRVSRRGNRERMTGLASVQSWKALSDSKPRSSWRTARQRICRSSISGAGPRRRTSLPFCKAIPALRRASARAQYSAVTTSSKERTTGRSTGMSAGSEGRRFIGCGAR
jgi:hypothetical protein